MEIDPIFDPRWMPLPRESGVTIADPILYGVDVLRKRSMNSDEPMPQVDARSSFLFFNGKRFLNAFPCRAAEYYATLAASCQNKWVGALPKSFGAGPKFTTYSRKVFIGGVPFDTSDEELLKVFEGYGDIQIIKPDIECSNSFSFFRGGYLHLVFEDESTVSRLLKDCSLRDGNSLIFPMYSRGRNVEIIPWLRSNKDHHAANVAGDATHTTVSKPPVDPCLTVFVGGLHGTVTSYALAHIMAALFGEVAYAGIDVDKFKYPIGSGRVSFTSQKSYAKAVAKGFVVIQTPRFTKKVQVDPYVEKYAVCSECRAQDGSKFCRDLACLRLFCQECWSWQHRVAGYLGHVSLVRPNTSP